MKAEAKPQQMVSLGYTPRRKSEFVKDESARNSYEDNSFYMDRSNPYHDVGYVRESGVEVLRKILSGHHLICSYNGIATPVDNPKSNTEYAHMGFSVHEVSRIPRISVVGSIDELDLKEIENHYGDFFSKKPRLNRNKETYKAALRRNSTVDLSDNVINLKNLKAAEAKLKKAVDKAAKSRGLSSSLRVIDYDFLYSVLSDELHCDELYKHDIVAIRTFKTHTLPSLMDIAIATNIIKEPTLDELIKALY